MKKKKQKNQIYYTVITLYLWALGDYLVQLPYFTNVKMNPEMKVLLLVTQLITGTMYNGTQDSL